jgi:hypothetical protein
MFFVDRDDILPDLAVVLFRHAPRTALQLLSRWVGSRWKSAVAMLEYAASDLLADAGPQLGVELNRAVWAALDCCALRSGDVPDEVDGVRRDHGG